ncbi:MAG: hypothetical protein L6R37_003480 [Teloschistes peruensis]|nr:MAG: hypothetical protein L6R37_003480 [Teloschistes peruensis]
MTPIAWSALSTTSTVSTQHCLSGLSVPSLASGQLLNPSVDHQVEASTDNACSDGIDFILVDYLLRPGLHVRKPRHAAGIAILTIYACLLLILALSYFRLVYAVTANPGYTPRGPQWHAQKKERRPSRPRQAAPRHVDPEKGNGVLEAPSTPNGGLPASPYAPVSSAYGPINDAVIPSLQEFYMRDVFTCESKLQQPRKGFSHD